MISAILAAALLLTDAAPTGSPAAHAEAPASDSAAATRSSVAKAADDKTAVKDAKAGKDVRICHLEEISGSRIPKKVCD